METFGRADDYNAANMLEIVRYVYNKTPNGCHGSPEIYNKWIKQGGLKGTLLDKSK